MTTSVLIIAHNEEQDIKECIESLLAQTQKPDEIILIVHNSTDKTLEIARKFPITIIPFSGEVGPVYARIEGLHHATGDIILCTDGDTVVKNNWVEVMSKTLQNNNILVGSYIKFDGTLFYYLSNIWNKYSCVVKNEKATEWLWGASFAFWNKDKDFVLETFKNCINYSRELNFPEGRIAEDYWLALSMSKRGNLEITNKTWVTTNPTEKSVVKGIARNRENHRNGHLISKYIHTSNL